MNTSFCIYLLLAIALVTAQDINRATGTTYEMIGATLPRPIYKKLFFAYSILTQTEILVHYDGSGSGTAREALLNNRGSYDVFITDVPFTDEEYVNHDYIYSFPILGSTVVPIFNIPNITDTMVLTPDLLAQILNGNITKWNDAKLVAYCPDLADVNRTIIIPVTAYESGTTLIYTTALSQLVPWWAEAVGPFGSWSEEQISRVTLREAIGGSPGVSLYVANVPYSIGIVPTPYAVTDSHTHIDLLINGVRRSAFTELNDDHDEIMIDDRLRSNLVGIFDWPMVDLTYIALDSEMDCGKFQKLMYFFNWAVNATGYISSEGYIPLPEELREAIEDSLFSKQCEGKDLIFIEFVHDETLYPTFVLVAILTVSFIMFSVFVYISTKVQEVQMEVEQFINISFAVGSEVLLLSVIFWYLEPSSDIICQIRLWMTTLGLMIITGVSVSKSWQLITINRMTAASKLQNNKIFFISMGASTSVQLVFLVIWAIIDPFKSVTVTLDAVMLQQEYTCGSSKLGIWLLVQLIFLLVLTLWGFFTTYYTWKLTSLYDPRFNLFSLYFTGVMLIAVAFLVSLADSEQLTFYITSISIFLLTSGTILPHFVQTVRKISKSHSIERTHKSASHSKAHSKAHTRDL